jgi:hypothetical protein
VGLIDDLLAKGEFYINDLKNNHMKIKGTRSNMKKILILD